MANRGLYRAFGATLVANAIIGLMNFVVQIYLARILGVEIVAEYARIVTLVQIVSLFTNFSFNHALIGIGYSVVGFHNTLSLNIIQFAIILSTWTVLGGVIAYLYPDDFFRSVSPAALYIIGSIALNFGHTINASIESKMHYEKLAVIRFCSFACSAFISLGLSIVDKSVFTMIVRDLVNGVAFLFLSFLLSTERIGFRLDKHVIAEIVSYSKRLLFVRGTSEGANRLTFTLLAMSLDKHQFGLYFQMRSLVDGIAAYLLNPIQSVLFSYFRLHRDRMDFRHFALLLLPIVSAVALIASLMAHLWGGWFVAFLFGPEWRPANVVLAPLVTNAAIMLYFEVLVSMAQAKNVMRPIILTRTCWIGAVVVLVPAMTIQYQLSGAGWATALASVVMLTVGIKLLLPRLGEARNGPLNAPIAKITD